MSDAARPPAISFEVDTDAAFTTTDEGVMRAVFTALGRPADYSPTEWFGSGTTFKSASMGFYVCGESGKREVWTRSIYQRASGGLTMRLEAFPITVPT